MASPQSSTPLTPKLAVTHYDVDPAGDTTDAFDVSWVDMRDFDSILVSFFRTVGTGDIDGFKIIANNNASGTGTDVTIKSHALGSQPNAVGDYVFLECTAEEIAQEGSDAGIENLRYVSVNIEFATGTDEGVVTYVRHGERQYSALTADTVS